MSGICETCGGPDHYPAPHYTRREARRIGRAIDRDMRRFSEDVTGQDAENEGD